MDIRDQIEPGDLLFSLPNPKNFSALTNLGRDAWVSIPQGTKFGHAAIVTSPSTLVEAQMGGVKEKPLDRWLDDNIAVFGRVQSSPGMRRKAAKRAREITGRDYSVWKAFKKYLWPKKKGEADGSVRERAQKMKSMICSTVVAIAYPDVDFHVGKDKLDVMPVDVLRSDKVEIIGTTIEEDTEDLKDDLKNIRPEVTLGAGGV